MPAGEHRGVHQLRSTKGAQRARGTQPSVPHLRQQQQDIHTCEDVPAACPAHALLPAARVRCLEQAQHFSVIGGGSAVPGSSEGDGEVHPRVVVLSCSRAGAGGRTRVTSSHGLVAWKCVRTDLSHLSLSHWIGVMAAHASQELFTHTSSVRSRGIPPRHRQHGPRLPPPQAVPAVGTT